MNIRYKILSFFLLYGAISFAAAPKVPIFYPNQSASAWSALTATLMQMNATVSAALSQPQQSKASKENYEIKQYDNTQHNAIARAILKEVLWIQSTEEEMLSESQKYTFYLLFTNNECVGLISYEDFGDNTCEIKLLAIRTKHQKKGFGSILLNNLISRFRSLKMKEVQLQSANSAVGFYTRKGFQQANPYYPQIYSRIIN